MESVSLYYTEGASNKEYHVQLKAAEGGCIVAFQYGRRGSSLRSDTKTPAPVPYEKAKKVFDKLVAEKVAKGYTTGESGTPFQDTDGEARATGILPQLLNAIDEADVAALIADDAWGMQEKVDGERRLTYNKMGGDVIGINKKGLSVPLPQCIANETAVYARGTLFDGELVGERLFSFDLLEAAGIDLRNRPYSFRHSQLAALVGPGAPIEVLPLATGATAKAKLLAHLRARGAEGVVFKRLDAPATAGRPNSGGTQRKFKFYDTATVLVAAVHATKRSIAVSGFDEAGAEVPLGNVTIPPNAPIPAIGEIVEVRYLYWYGVGGSLYQPVYLGVRGDQDRGDCGIGQLKLKAAGVANGDLFSEAA